MQRLLTLACIALFASACSTESAKDKCEDDALRSFLETACNANLFQLAGGANLDQDAVILQCALGFSLANECNGKSEGDLEDPAGYLR